MIKHVAPTANHSASKYPSKTGYLEGVNLSWCPVGFRIDVPGNCSMRRLERLFWCATSCTAQAGFSTGTRSHILPRQSLHEQDFAKDE